MGFSVMSFEFATATQIIFGAGTIRQIGSIAGKWGKRVLIVADSRTQRVQPLVDQLAEADLYTSVITADAEPTVASITAGVEAARAAACDLVIAMGGGSVMDTGKAIGALLTNGGAPLDYLEVIGRGRPLTEPSAPTIAIPTTAGTGAEVTRNAVLFVPEHRVKVSLRSPYMLPRLALIDPELTYTMPPSITASTGLDALTQCMEPYVSNQANPLTDAIAREGVRRAARSLRKAFIDGTDAAAREDLSLASLFGGLALANAKLGAVHGFAGVLGGMIAIPHGIVCARLLPFVMETNVRALQERMSASPALARYDEIARIVTGDSQAAAADGVAWVQELCAELAVPPLRQFGLTESDFGPVVAMSQKASSMKGNPLPLSDVELTGVLQLAL